MLNAREAALEALLAYRRRGARPEMVVSGADTSEKDLALATNIVLGVLQNEYYLDYCIEAAAGRKISRLEPSVAEILRVGAYQILFLTRVPKSAAVDESVKLCKQHSKNASGLVNAVLRNLKAEKTDDLSIKYSHPRWLVDELTREYGEEKAERILYYDNQPRKTTLIANPLRSADLSALERHPELSNAYLYSGSVESLEAFRLGAVYAQDMSAYLAAAEADPKPGDTVLDACAAPGGKSFACAGLMKNAGKIYSRDIHEKKLRLIKSGAERLGIGIIETEAFDASKPDERLREKCDVVICDVPCSGMGVIAKKPEIRYKPESELVRLPEVQLRILSAQSEAVRNGGVLVYSTCTILSRENGEVVNKFLVNHGEFEKITEKTILPSENCDGFYICRMRKKST